MSKYTAGIALNPEGGALVVVEKCPRMRKGFTNIHAGDADAWEDVLKIVGVERLSGRITDMVGASAAHLSAEPLVKDCITYIDVGPIGPDIMQLFYKSKAWPLALALGGEIETTENGRMTVPRRNLEASVRLVLEGQRLDVLKELPQATTLLKLLGEPATVPSSGPTADLATAAMIGVWTAHRYPTRGFWPSRKPPKPGTPAAHRLEEIEMRRRTIARAKEAANRRWWERKPEWWTR
jgi:hypothetical protein